MIVLCALVVWLRLLFLGARRHLVAVSCLGIFSCGALFFFIFTALAWGFVYQLQPRSPTEARHTLTDLSDHLLNTRLHLPNSTTPVESFVDPGAYPGRDPTLFYKLQISHNEIEQFMQQGPMQSNWQYGNAVATHLPSTLKWRWREMFRAKDCRSWVGKEYQSSDVVITVCLDSTAGATVYILEFCWQR